MAARDSRRSKDGGLSMSSDRSRGFTGSSVAEGYDQFLLGQLFVPWAHDLVGRAGLTPTQRVLDVASGLGPVARLAAAAVGAGGEVVASDISAPMLARASEYASRPAAAAIEYLECSATSIASDDDRFDAVLCQQGVQFFPERAQAAGEMARVVRADGVVVVSAWASERPLGLFGPIAETLAELDFAEPYPGAFNPSSYSLSVGELGQLLIGAGLRDVVVVTATVDAIWPSLDEAVSTLLGTPFNPLVAARPADEQQRVRAVLAKKFHQSGEGTIVVATTANTAVGYKG